FVVDSLTAYHRNKENPENEFYADKMQLSEITERERTFIVHCCSELAYKEIASLMDVSPRTVDGYREAVFTKLNLKSRIGIVLFALRNGLFKPVLPMEGKDFQPES